MLRSLALLPLCAMMLVAEPGRVPAIKIQRGFQALSNGTWEQALQEWNDDGALPAARLDEVRLKLTKMGLEPRTIGEYTGIHPPLLQPLWQRHWLVATFDTGAAFFCLDYMAHKGEWRLCRIEVAANPMELLPSLDQKSMPVRTVER